MYMITKHDTLVNEWRTNEEEEWMKNECDENFLNYMMHIGGQYVAIISTLNEQHVSNIGNNAIKYNKTTYLKPHIMIYKVTN